MKIIDVLKKETIVPDLKAGDKKGVIEEIALPVARTADIEHETLVSVLLERERLGSTGIGGGVGIPHGKIKNLNSLVMGCGLSRNGIDFESIDRKPTHIFFLLVTPEKSTGLHLTLLARISRILKSEPFKERLIRASSTEEIYEIIKNEDDSF